MGLFRTPSRNHQGKHTSAICSPSRVKITKHSGHQNGIPQEAIASQAEEASVNQTLPLGRPLAKVERFPGLHHIKA